MLLENYVCEIVESFPWHVIFMTYRKFFIAILVITYQPTGHHHHHHQPTFTTSRVPEREIVVIYIHPLKTGLFRIMVATVFG